MEINTEKKKLSKKERIIYYYKKHTTYETFCLVTVHNMHVPVNAKRIDIHI